MGTAFQILLLLLLLWLAADQGAHQRLHELAKAPAASCSHHQHACATAITDDSHATHPHGHDDSDVNCVVTLFAQGHANLMALPPVIESFVPQLLFLNGAAVVPMLPPSPQLLPHSCGPPVLPA